MKRFPQIIVLAGMSAVLFCGIDVLLALLVQNNFLNGQNYGWADKVHLISSDFYILFLVFFICSSLIVAISKKFQIAGLLTASGFLVLYAISWVTFFKINEFLDVEGVRFFFYNFFHILAHIYQTSVALLVLLFVILICVPLLVGPLFRKYTRACFKSLNDNPRASQIGLIILLLLSFGATLVSMVYVKDKEALQRTLRSNLSPQATLIADFFTPGLRRSVIKRESNLVMRWSRQVSLPQFKEESGSSINNAPVICVVVESMRSDVLNDSQVMPNLFKLKQDSLYFNHAFPPSNQTDYAWPAIMSSQYPRRSPRHYYYPKNISFPRVLIYDILKEHGYKTAIFSAQNEEWSGMRRYLDSSHLDMFFDATSEISGQYIDPSDYGFQLWAEKFKMAGKIDDAVVLGHALDWIEKEAGTKFFLALNFQRSHFPYTWPQEHIPRFAPFEIDFDALFGKYPKSKVPLMKNRYNNALSYIDNQIGRLVEFLKDKKLYDQSLIIVLGDHGEAFYEKAISCHASDLDAASTRTSILFKAPFSRLKGTKDDFVQSIDIPPTICHFLNIKSHPSFQGEDLLIRRSDHHPIFMSVNSTSTNQDAIILDGWKFIKDYKFSREFLFSLKEDLMEANDVMQEFPNKAASLRDQLRAWRDIQLDYYQDQEKQKEFYPPKVIFGRAD